MTFPFFRSNLDLSDAIEQTSTALKLFLNNKFTDAKARMEPGFVIRSSKHNFILKVYLEANLFFGDILFCIYKKEDVV